MNRCRSTSQNSFQWLWYCWCCNHELLSLATGRFLRSRGHCLIESGHHNLIPQHNSVVHVAQLVCAHLDEQNAAPTATTRCQKLRSLSTIRLRMLNRSGCSLRRLKVWYPCLSENIVMGWKIRMTWVIRGQTASSWPKISLDLFLNLVTVCR